VAYLGYTLRMRTLFRGWPIMVNDTHTRRRRLTVISVSLQGSVLDPIMFCLYISPIADLVLQYGESLQQYADDTQLYISCSVNDAASALSTLESCLASLHSWFCYNGLAVNPSKSEAIIFGTHQSLNSFPVILCHFPVCHSRFFSAHVWLHHNPRRHTGLKPHSK